MQDQQLRAGYNAQKSRRNEIVIEQDGGDNTNYLCKSVIAIGGTREFLTVGERSVRKEEEDVGSNEDFVCEKNDGTTIPIIGNDNQIQQLRTMLNDGRLISSETTIAIPASSGGIEMLEIDDENLSSMEEILVLPPGSIKLIDDDDTRRQLRSTRRRKLASYEGAKPVLVVRVTDVDGKVVRESAEEVSDKFFGTLGDTMTLKSQFAACSFNKLQITNEYSSDVDDRLLSAPGVLDVEISVSLENTQSVIRNAIQKAVEKTLGVDLPGPFQHVVYVLEACYVKCGWAGYAFVNSWNVVTQGNYYKYPAGECERSEHWDGGVSRVLFCFGYYHFYSAIYDMLI